MADISIVNFGKAIGRSRQTVDVYIADLRAVNQMDLDIKIFRLNCLCIPQDRIAERLGLARTSFQYHLPKMPVLANSANDDLKRGFTVAQVAEKYGWLLSMQTGGIFRFNLGDNLLDKHRGQPYQKSYRPNGILRRGRENQTLLFYRL